MGCSNRVFNTALCLTRHHQRISRNLAGRELQQCLQIALKNFIGLASESEDHVDVADREKFLRFCNVFKDFLTGSEFIALGHFQNAVIKALNADRHAVHQTFKHVNLRIPHDLRICFDRDFLDGGKQLFSQLQRFGQLVHQHCGRAAADVHRRKVITHGMNGLHLFAQIHKVFAGLVSFEKESMEGAIGTKRFTERNMCIQHIFMAFLRKRKLLKNTAVKR